MTSSLVACSANYPNGITVGPDGNLWFTDSGLGMIGRITPSGQVTEFKVPYQFSRPAYIVTGPDGNLWFTDPGSGAIGRVAL